MSNDISIIMKSVHGSHLYGTNTEDSDKDFKGIFINKSISKVLLKKSIDKINFSTGEDCNKNSSSDTDIELYEINRFIREACQGQTICIDMLHTPEECIIEKGPLYYIWQDIRKNRHLFYSKNMNAFIGYAKKQAAKYGIKGSRMGCLEEVYKVVKTHYTFNKDKRYNYKLENYKGYLPTNEYCKFVTGFLNGREDQEFYEVLGSKYQLTMPFNDFYKAIKAKWSSYGDRARQAKENKGVDWKAISHALRAGYQLKEIFKFGDIKYPLTCADYLLEVKLGNLDFLTEVQPELERLITEVEVLAEHSNLPESSDLSFWENKVLDWYKEYYNIK